MKFTVTAATLADALACCAGALDAKAKIETLHAVHLTTDGTAISVTANFLDRCITAIFAADVERSGECALKASALSALVSSMTGDIVVDAAPDAKTAIVRNGRSVYKLSTWPVSDVPQPLAIDQEIGKAEVTRETALHLFEKPLPCVSQETARYYLNGILLHDDDGDLAAAATDGHRLARFISSVGNTLSQDRRCIVPLANIKPLIRLLRKSKSEVVGFRRSRTLIEVKASEFCFTSKLIDADFPSYERLIPSPSRNSVVINRAELSLALGRLSAAATPAKVSPVAGIEWDATTDVGAMRLCLSREPGTADDILDAEIEGAGRVAFSIDYMGELLGGMDGKVITLNVGDPASPFVITDPEDSATLRLLMPARW